MPAEKMFFWIKFDRDDRPYKFVVENMLDFNRQVETMCRQRGEMFEWIIRDYK